MVINVLCLCTIYVSLITSGCGLEGGGSPCNIPGPAQGLQRLEQVQVPGYTGWMWRGARALCLLRRYWEWPKIVLQAGGFLQSTLPHIERYHPGRPTVAHHFKCGGGRGGLPLGIPGVGTGGTRQQQ